MKDKQLFDQYVEHLDKTIEFESMVNGFIERLYEEIKKLKEKNNCLQSENAEQKAEIEKGTLIDIKTISKLLNEWFECPCNFTLNEEDVALYMFEKYGNWCEKNCGKMLEDYSPCWEMYLKAKLKELQNG